MAAFCTPRFYHGAAAEPIAIKGLFHFLDNLQDDLALQSVLQESLSQQQGSAPAPAAEKQQQPLPYFTPRFDISETDAAYHLNGELAGLSKEHIDIDFTDAQTITVRGKIQRAASSPAQTTDDDVVVEDAAPQSPASSAASSHHATVEDDFEDLAAETNTATSSSSPAPEKTTEKTPAPQQQPEAKYWIAERKYGQFARSFKFRKTVDVAAVSASLENGVLSIVVPKKNESRKIFVN
ncbi:HSP20-like chaperone [Microdochium trichocladiopsis]|uniref:HSP20-like chaperone n=1 Tax=Microdochium trichocladiopsis TaxID=1682393 RepID=A0A9P8XZJ6_9PEZI|nr:HSP20-like chaperone [Microdochium trichocladiopsis]KAH7024538.1 HSP20-like chaperone [Microdochium trichocladiopsis]